MHKSLVIGLVVLLRVSVLSGRYCLFLCIRQVRFNMAEHLSGLGWVQIPSAYWLCTRIF